MSSSLRTLLIANRGEIAVHIARTLKKMGFSDNGVCLERFVDDPRHVKVQLLLLVLELHGTPWTFSLAGSNVP